MPQEPSRVAETAVSGIAGPRGRGPDHPHQSAQDGDPRIHSVQVGQERLPNDPPCQQRGLSLQQRVAAETAGGEGEGLLGGQLLSGLTLSVPNFN